MIFDAIELKDPDYGTVKKSSKIRKIKFKSISFKNISNLWKNFRLNLLNKRLENAKEKLVSMELNNQDFNNNTIKGNMKVAEKKILRKTTAVAKLESRIEFLKTGHETTDDFVSSRAIKLKDKMMKNMRYNCNSAYSILPEAKEEERMNAIFGPEKEIEEATKRIGAEVRRIMDEDAAKKEVVTEPVQEQETEPVANTTITAPSTEEIREAVNEAFAAHEKVMSEQEPIPETEEQVIETEETSQENTITEEEVQETVEEAMNTINVEPTLTEDEIATTVEDAFDKIDVMPKEENTRVSSNESTAAKNKYINDDGTYRMKREDIDEDFRKLKIIHTEPPQNTMVGMLRASLKAAGYNVVDIPKKEDPQIENRNMPVVVPERKMTPVEQVKELSAAVDEVQTMDDIQAIMASVAELKAQTEKAEQEAAAAAQSTARLKQEKTAAVQDLLDYQAALKAGLAESQNRVAAEQQAASALENEIQSIRSITGRR